VTSVATQPDSTKVRQMAGCRSRRGEVDWQF
jgi:hypothetical protein